MAYTLIPGGGGSLPLEAVPDAREKIRGKGVSKSGVGPLYARYTKRVSKSVVKPIREKGYPNRYMMIRVLAVRSNLERADNSRQQVH